MQSNGWPYPGFLQSTQGTWLHLQRVRDIPSRVQSFMFLILFIPQSKLPHACLEVLLKSICTSIILSIRTVVETTVGEDPSHIRDEESSSCVVASL